MSFGAISKYFRSRSAFTLIELLVVIAIIAILAVVVVLTLNPAELLRQSRDANRISDMATLNSAINLYTTDQNGAPSFSLGVSSTSYMSVSDLSATSTAGDQCQGLGLSTVTTSTGQSWGCAGSSTYRNANGTGWIPVNFNAISSGNPLGSLPVDPVNQTSSGFFYTYSTNGTQFEATGLLESQKYKLQYANAPLDPYYPEVNAKGSNLALSPLYNPAGLVEYWPLDEGSGMVVSDQSGNGNNGTWSGTMPYYASANSAKVGTYAGNFDGSTDQVTIPDSANVDFTSGSSYTLAAWINANRVSSGGIISKGCVYGYGMIVTSGKVQFGGHNGGNFLSSSTLSTNTWYFIVATYNPSTSPEGSLYINGQLDATSPSYPYATNSVGSSTYIGINCGTYFSGIIDDARVYGRALSAAEVQALYNAER